MSSKPENTVPERRPKMSASDVADYLAKNPNFLSDHPELVEVLVPPSERTERNVLDMQRFMVERMQRTLGQVKARQGEIVEATRSNLSSLSRIHAAVLALYEPSTFHHLIDVITTDVAEILEVDVVTICVESVDAEPGKLASTSGVIVLEPGTVDALIGRGKAATLRDELDSENVVFGGASTLVKSDALARLAVGQKVPPALLAMGSRNKDRFTPSQGTDLLTFLGSAMSHRMREWLEQDE
jgi:uncharacterized protein YigA (DUF484 family)